PLSPPRAAPARPTTLGRPRSSGSRRRSGPAPGAAAGPRPRAPRCPRSRRPCYTPWGMCVPCPSAETGPQEAARSRHSLLSVTIGVPNLTETAAYYTDFGLTPGEDGWFSTADAGPQLRLRHAPIRRLLELKVGADDADDLAQAAAGLARLGVSCQQNG